MLKLLFLRVSNFYWRLELSNSAVTWTKLEYLRRFTQAERITIRATAKLVPELDDYMQLMELSSEVRNDDPDVINALEMLEGAGLIGIGRAAEILDVPASISEVLPIPATVYLVGSTYVTVPVGGNAPAAFERSWPVSALVAQLIAEGANVRSLGTELEVFAKAVA